MRLLVCGGRRYLDCYTVNWFLDDFARRMGITLLIEGGATGADKLARDWATTHGVAVKTFAVSQQEWDTLGKKAGPLRNQKMIDEGRPDHCIAFPGGRGTADMVNRCLRARIPVTEIGTKP